MWNSKTSVRFSLFLTYFFMVLLAVITVALPFIVTWYVEVAGRSQSLPTTIMVASYPCVPFAAAALLSLRRLLINIQKSDIFIEQNVSMLRRISWCCIIAAIITLIAGRFYLPFYIVCVSALFYALITRVFKNIIHGVISEGKTEKED